MIEIVLICCVAMSESAFLFFGTNFEKSTANESPDKGHTSHYETDDDEYDDIPRDHSSLLTLVVVKTGGGVKTSVENRLGLLYASVASL
jgi:hypothetical protein